MATNCSNLRAAQSFKGTSVYVTLSGAEAISILPYLAIGTQCTINSNSKVGYVDLIDVYGHVFRMKPQMPTTFCDSDTPGILKVNEIITVNI